VLDKRQEEPRPHVGALFIGAAIRAIPDTRALQMASECD